MKVAVIVLFSVLAACSTAQPEKSFTKLSFPMYEIEVVPIPRSGRIVTHSGGCRVSAGDVSELRQIEDKDRIEDNTRLVIPTDCSIFVDFGNELYLEVSKPSKEYDVVFRIQST